MSKNTDYHAIAQRYTTALFELAEDAKKLKPVASELEALGVLLEQSEDFARLCNNPTIDIKDRNAAIAAIVKKYKPSSLVANFLNTLVENNRMDCLSDIIAEFAKRIHINNDELVAEVTSAIPLKKVQQTKLEKTLKEHFGKKVALNININESLLGGLRIRVAGQLIDASIAGRLQRLTTHLNAGIQQIA